MHSYTPSHSLISLSWSHRGGRRMARLPGVPSDAPWQIEAARMHSMSALMFGYFVDSTWIRIIGDKVVDNKSASGLPDCCEKPDRKFNAFFEKNCNQKHFETCWPSANLFPNQFPNAKSALSSQPHSSTTTTKKIGSKSVFFSIWCLTLLLNLLKFVQVQKKKVQKQTFLRYFLQKSVRKVKK